MIMMNDSDGAVAIDKWKPQDDDDKAAAAADPTLQCDGEETAAAATA